MDVANADHRNGCATTATIAAIIAVALLGLLMQMSSG